MPCSVTNNPQNDIKQLKIPTSITSFVLQCSETHYMQIHYIQVQEVDVLPMFRRPRMICRTAQQRDSTTASVTEPRANVAVSNDVTAVGPMFTSFDVPSRT